MFQLVSELSSVPWRSSHVHLQGHVHLEVHAVTLLWFWSEVSSRAGVRELSWAVQPDRKSADLIIWLLWNRISDTVTDLRCSNAFISVRWSYTEACDLLSFTLSSNEKVSGERRNLMKVNSGTTTTNKFGYKEEINCWSRNETTRDYRYLVHWKKHLEQMPEWELCDQNTRRSVKDESQRVLGSLSLLCVALDSDTHLF